MIWGFMIPSVFGHGNATVNGWAYGGRQSTKVCSWKDQQAVGKSLLAKAPYSVCEYWQCAEAEHKLYRL